MAARGRCAADVGSPTDLPAPQPRSSAPEPTEPPYRPNGPTGGTAPGSSVPRATTRTSPHRPDPVARHEDTRPTRPSYPARGHQTYPTELPGTRTPDLPDRVTRHEDTRPTRPSYPARGHHTDPTELPGTRTPHRPDPVARGCDATAPGTATSGRTRPLHGLQNLAAGSDGGDLPDRDLAVVDRDVDAMPSDQAHGRFAHAIV